MPSPKHLSGTLSLEEFLFRQQIRSIYKQVVRVVYKHHEKFELMRFLRHEFKLSSDHDLTYRKYLLNQGIGRINDMAAVMGVNIHL